MCSAARAVKRWMAFSDEEYADVVAFTYSNISLCVVLDFWPHFSDYAQLELVFFTGQGITEGFVRVE